MQVNQRVWRGFYDPERLRWDTRYNTRAGAQILMRYVKDYALPYAERRGDPNLIPRAAYAVYNAGPRAVARFDKKPPHPREARVDEKLWTLYKGLASGGQVDLKSCGVKDSGLAIRQPSSIRDTLRYTQSGGATLCSQYRDRQRAARSLLIWPSIPG
jgi:hypothetical protein